MADKFLGIGGVYVDDGLGKAKAIRTDEDGFINSSITYETINESTRVIISPGQKYRVKPLPGYRFRGTRIGVGIRIQHGRVDGADYPYTAKFKVLFLPATPDGRTLVEDEDRIPLIDTTYKPANRGIADYEIKTNHGTIDIENHDDEDILVGWFTLTDFLK